MQTTKRVLNETQIIKGSFSACMNTSGSQKKYVLCYCVSIDPVGTEVQPLMLLLTLLYLRRLGNRSKWKKLQTTCKKEKYVQVNQCKYLYPCFFQASLWSPFPTWALRYQWSLNYISSFLLQHFLLLLWTSDFFSCCAQFLSCWSSKLLSLATFLLHWSSCAFSRPTKWQTPLQLDFIGVPPHIRFISHGLPCLPYILLICRSYFLMSIEPYRNDPLQKC